MREDGFGERGLAALDGNGVPDFAVASRFGLFYFEGPLFELFADGFEAGDAFAWSATVP